MGDAWVNLARAFGEPIVAGEIKRNPGDFKVEEFLSFEPEGAGEHWLVQLKKVDHNTPWVASALAKFAGVSPKHVGYAGLKDRKAETIQWYSVPAANSPVWADFDMAGVQLLQTVRHRAKLKPGALTLNRFEITIHLQGSGPDEVKARAHHIAQEGVPNYFGEQRFGREASNLRNAAAWFSGGRAPKYQHKGLCISAARSLLFNQILSQRVLQGNWSLPIPGDRMVLDGSRSHFHVEHTDQTLFDRAAAHDIHPSGAMWGKGEPETTESVYDLELSVASRYPVLRDGLADLKLRQERRSLRVRPRNLTINCSDDRTCVLGFDLPPGTYATSVLREVIRVPTMDQVSHVRQ